MLLRVDIGSVTQRCDVCGTRGQVAWSSLRAGVETEEPVEPLDPNVIRMPECAACGSTEFLIRVTRSDDAPDVPTLDHRRGVNGLHAALVEAQRIAPSLAAYFSTENVTSDRAPPPWEFAHEPVPPTRAGLPDPTASAFSAFLNGGG